MLCLHLYHRWWFTGIGKSSYIVQCMWFVSQIPVCPSTYRSLDWLYNQVTLFKKKIECISYQPSFKAILEKCPFRKHSKQEKGLRSKYWQGQLPDPINLKIESVLLFGEVHIYWNYFWHLAFKTYMYLGPCLDSTDWAQQGPYRKD